MLFISGDVQLPIANHDVRASIAASAMCPSTSLLAPTTRCTMMRYFHIVILLILLCDTIYAAEQFLYLKYSTMSIHLIKNGEHSYQFTAIIDDESGIDHSAVAEGAMNEPSAYKKLCLALGDAGTRARFTELTLYNVLGSQGWELVNLSESSQSDATGRSDFKTALFKRRL